MVLTFRSFTWRSWWALLTQTVHTGVHNSRSNGDSRTWTKPDPSQDINKKLIWLTSLISLNNSCVLGKCCNTDKIHNATLKTRSYHPVMAGDHGVHYLNVEENWDEQRWSHCKRDSYQSCMWSPHGFNHFKWFLRNLPRKKYWCWRW